jgi:hypothetical protein
MLLQNTGRQHCSKILEEFIMLNKRIMSLTLAALTTAAMAAPAFAASANSTVITGTYADVPIAVTVPATGTVTINPYKLPIDVTKSDGTTKAQISGEQITTVPLAIKNDGTVALDVGATVTTTNGKSSGITLTNKSTVPASGETASTDKNAFVYLEVVSITADSNDTAKAVVTDESVTDATQQANKLSDAIIDACADDETWGEYKASKSGAYPDNMLVLSTDDPVSASNLGTLAAAKTAKTENAAAVYDVGSIALFRLAGDCITAPDEAWSTKDTFTATIAFTFTPSES